MVLLFLVFWRGMMREERTPDSNKAKALRKMALELLERLSNLSLIDFPSPNLSDYYDAIHMLIDSILTSKGIKFKGDGAHYELIEEACKQKIISQGESTFLQQIRNMRNKYKYEGFSVSIDFVERNEEKILKIVEKLEKQIIQ